MARFAWQVIPGLRAIFTGGRNADEAVQAFGVADCHFLPKPFAAVDLLRRIATAQ